MKKKSIKSLGLNKKSISSLTFLLNGGMVLRHEDTSDAMSCVNYTKEAAGCPPATGTCYHTYCGPGHCISVGN